MSQYINTPQPPIGTPTPGPAQRGVQRSGMAIAALCLGIGSLVCFGPLLGIPALILGIIALSAIGKSDGQLTGKGFAISGICLGVVGSAIFILAMVMPALIGDLGDGSSGSDVDSAFEIAEKNIRSKKSDQTGFGNTPEAAVLADQFSSKMKILRASLFTGEAKGGLSGGEFLTHCEMNEDRCAFIVHVPGLRKFNEEAKKSLCDIAWTIAWGELAESDLPDGSQLAVGVKGFALYEDIMIGEYLREDDSAEPSSGSSTDRLKPFFPEPLTEEREIGNSGTTGETIDLSSEAGGPSEEADGATEETSDSNQKPESE